MVIALTSGEVMSGGRKLPPAVRKGQLTTDGSSWNKNTVSKKGRRLKRGDRRDKERTGGREERWQVEGG